MQRHIAIERIPNLSPDPLQGIAIVLAVVVTCLHHDTAPVCGEEGQC